MTKQEEIKIKRGLTKLLELPLVLKDMISADEGEFPQKMHEAYQERAQEIFNYLRSIGALCEIGGCMGEA